MGRAARERANASCSPPRSSRRGPRRSSSGHVPMKPRVLFVGRTRYRLPLPPWLGRKWDAVGDTLDYSVLASAVDGARSSSGRVRADRRGRRPRTASPSTRGSRSRSARDPAVPSPRRSSPRTRRPRAAHARPAPRGPPRAKVVCEVHGDWRHSTRLYGALGGACSSPLARRDRPLGRAARRRCARALPLHDEARGGRARRAAGGRLSRRTATLGLRGAAAAAAARRAAALFVGVLERYKNVDGLAAAWRRVAGRLPARARRRRQGAAAG